MVRRDPTATVEGFEARRRASVFHQALRFVVLNLKILQLTRHHA